LKEWRREKKNNESHTQRKTVDRSGRFREAKAGCFRGGKVSCGTEKVYSTDWGEKSLSKTGPSQKKWQQGSTTRGTTLQGSWLKGVRTPNVNKSKAGKPGAKKRKRGKHLVKVTTGAEMGVMVNWHLPKTDGWFVAGLNGAIVRGDR